MPDAGIVVNGEMRALPAGGQRVAELLTELGVSGQQRVAVMLNGEIVSRSDYPECLLRVGDRVEVLTLARGG